jgi:hypothetical protein
MSNFLVIGDSHGEQLSHVAGAQYFKADHIVPTAREFVNFGSELWTKLDPWLTNCKGMDLVVCLGEIDIRAHYWRQLPRYNLPPEQYVQSSALALYRAIGHAVNLYELNSATLWASPPAAEARQGAYNHTYPFAGDIATRNRIIHLFNREFVGFLEPQGPIRFASAFYDYVDSGTYTTLGHTPTDGIHYRGDQYGRFFSELIEPCIGGETVRVSNSENFTQMHKHQFGITSKLMTRDQGNYDTWVKNDGIKYQVADLTQIHFMGEAYTFMPWTQRLNLQDEYTELTLVNR